MRVGDRKAFAEACGSTFAHVRNVAYRQKPCSPSLAVNIERESRRQVLAESLCPDFDWAYLRNSCSPPPAAADSISTARDSPAA